MACGAGQCSVPGRKTGFLTCASGLQKSVHWKRAAELGIRPQWPLPSLISLVNSWMTKAFAMYSSVQCWVGLGGHCRWKTAQG